MGLLTVTDALSDAEASGNAAKHTSAAAPPSSFSNAKTASKIFGAAATLLLSMTFSHLSAAVVGIAVTIAAIGPGATADDAGASSERKSRLFVVSGVLAHNTAHGQHKKNIPHISFLSFAPLLQKGDVICAH